MADAIHVCIGKTGKDLCRKGVMESLEKREEEL